MGRENFLVEGRVANTGKANFGMMWASVMCLLLSAVMFCSAGAGRRSIRRDKPMSHESDTDIEDSG